MPPHSVPWRRGAFDLENFIVSKCLPFRLTVLHVDSSCFSFVCCILPLLVPFEPVKGMVEVIRCSQRSPELTSEKF